MRWSFLTAAALISAVALGGSATLNAKEKKDITLRGCVVQGESKGTFAMNGVTTVGSAPIPDYAHGRRVVYWLKDLQDLTPYVGKMVELRGKLDKFKDSEIEIKAGRHDGQLYVEFEGPGKNVTVPESSVGASVGTAGRVAPGNDIKTMLAVVDVKHVRGVGDVCQ